MRRKSGVLFLILKILGLVGMLGQLLEMVIGDKAMQTYIDESVEEKFNEKERNNANDGES